MPQVTSTTFLCSRVLCCRSVPLAKLPSFFYALPYLLHSHSLPFLVLAFAFNCLLLSSCPRSFVLSSPPSLTSVTRCLSSLSPSLGSCLFLPPSLSLACSRAFSLSLSLSYTLVYLLRSFARSLFRLGPLPKLQVHAVLFFLIAATREHYVFR